MKKVTYEEFLKLDPCWLHDGRAEKLERIGKRREYWTAMHILKLKKVSVEDKFWAVLRKEFMEENTMNEFACQCAELELASIENPDERSTAAIVLKRAWMKGEITDEELKTASDAASAAFAAARAAAWYAARAASYAAWYAECQVQVDMLIELLESEGENVIE